MVRIDESSVQKLIEKYSFSVPDSAMVIVAIRGCLPELCLRRDAEKSGVPEEYKVIMPKHIDYRTTSCTIGVWFKEIKEIALFPGSTVPSLDYLHAFPESVKHFNILCPGKYEFERGVHPRRSSAQERHHALIMQEQGWVAIPKVIRKADESFFDFSRMRYEIMYARDNIHASRTEPFALTQNMFNCPYSSSGCLSIIGQPKQYIRNGEFPFFWNFWEQFMNLINCFSSINDRIPLLLFDYSDFAIQEKKEDGSILRYGSEGGLVAEIQEKLSQISKINNEYYYTDSIDGKFLASTAHAYLQFMKDYLPDKIAGEANLYVFHSHTRHFKYKSKIKYYVIH